MFGMVWDSRTKLRCMLQGSKMPVGFYSRNSILGICFIVEHWHGIQGQNCVACFMGVKFQQGFTPGI